MNNLCLLMSRPVSTPVSTRTPDLPIHLPDFQPTDLPTYTQ